jgi:hypothetical protein
MRSRSAIAVSILLGLGIATPCSADSMPWAGTLAFELVARPPVAFTGSGVAVVNGSTGGVHLIALSLAGGITGSATILPVTDPELATLLSVRGAVTLGTGRLSPFSPLGPPSQPQLTQRTLPIRGAFKFCLFLPGCGSYLPLPLTINQGQTGIGVGGGLLTVGAFGSGPAISIQGAPWTVGIASLPVATTGGGSATLVAAGWVHGPLTFSSSTAVAGGSVSLVSPVRVISDAGQALGMFARLTVRFIPEPGLVLLLGSGISALAVMGRGRIRP